MKTLPGPYLATLAPLPSGVGPFGFDVGGRLVVVAIDDSERIFVGYYDSEEEGRYFDDEDSALAYAREVENGSVRL